MSIAIETVRFDTQALQNPEISGIEYQQGELLGYEIREYLLEKFNRTCVYCDAKNIPLEIEHVVPKSCGGSNRISNLVIACHDCNQSKDTLPLENFVSDPARIAKIKSRMKAPLKDAAAVNATRYAIGNTLKSFGLPITFWSGGRTKMNRIAQGYKKDHWIDAACVGEHGAHVTISPNMQAVAIKAVGRGSRQVRRTNAYGFPRGLAKRVKDVRGFRTGDLVRLVQPSGKYAGTHTGHVAVRARAHFDVATQQGRKITAPSDRFMLLQRHCGYVVA